MDTLANLLQPYKEVVGHVTTLVTVIQMLSGTFICWDIYKQGSTRGIGITPLLGGLVLNILNLKYGYIIRDDPIIQVSLLGLFLHIIYSLFYFQYTNEKMKVWVQFGFSSLLSAAVIGYAQVEDPGLVEDRFGWIITVLFLILIASPLSELKSVIKNQSTEGMPFPIILSGAVVSFAWLVYGFILRNDLLVIQNVVAVLLSAVQLLLFIIYPSKPKDFHMEGSYAGLFQRLLPVRPSLWSVSWGGHPTLCLPVPGRDLPAPTLNFRATKI